MLYEGARDSRGAGANQAGELLERAGIGSGDPVNPETGEFLADLLRGARDRTAYSLEIDREPAFEDASCTGNARPLVDLIEQRHDRRRQLRRGSDRQVNVLASSAAGWQRRIDEPKRG